MIKLARFTPLSEILVLAILAIATSAAAQTLTGTVTNGTSNKPAAGDEVILINLSNGMDVADKTKADSAGKFSFTLKDGPGGPHLIRAIHQGVTYHQMAPPGTNSVDVKVYDVVRKLDGLNLTADVMRLQADATSLQGIRLFAIDNTSSPAVTQMNDHNFEFYLPAGAKIEQVQAKAPNGQPIAAEAVPQAEKNRYAIAFPLRPGETQFQLEFTLPYKGEITLDPKPLYPSEHLVVVLPKTMQFKAANPQSFQSMQDPSQGDSIVEVAQQAKPGQPYGFTVQGTGTINDTPAQTASGAAQQSGQTPRNGPGGGLGVPIGTPDPLQEYRWWILGAFAVLLTIGGWIVTKRQGVSPITAAANASKAAPVNPASAATVTAPTIAAMPVAKSSSMLLEALKEEIFQLEVERKQGKITQQEYDKTKAALDQTLERALKRQ